jgi:mRNA interferase MazF
MPFERGEIVLLAFPFSSEAGVKQRPALVLLDAKNQDLVVARVTTQTYQSPFDITV